MVRILQYFLYEPKTRTGSLVTIVNDWDGGMNFWPIGCVNDKQVYMPIAIQSIQKALDQIKANKETIKYPEKHQQLIKMSTELDPFSNPIIMIVTLNSIYN